MKHLAAFFVRAFLLSRQIPKEAESPSPSSQALSGTPEGRWVIAASAGSAPPGNCGLISFASSRAAAAIPPPISGIHGGPADAGRKSGMKG